MVQIVKDFALRLKGDRKVQVITGLAVICILVLVFGEDGGRRGPRQAPKVEVGANDQTEVWKDLIERFTGELNSVRTATTALREDVDQQKKAMQDYENATTEIFKKILERIAEMQSVNANTGMGGSPTTLDGVAGDGLVATQPDELEQLGPIEVTQVTPPEQPKKPKLAAIMPGDSCRVKLLAGVNAPTDGTPYPVVMKLVGDVLGPDGNSVPLGEARVIAAAQGSLVDSRVLFRLTRLSVRLPNGRRKEFAIDGWVVGEDGSRGLEGVTIDPLGKALIGAGMAGTLAGVGAGIAVANQQQFVNNQFGTQNTTVLNEDIPAFALGQGMIGAANQWQQILTDRLSQLVPVVQVLSNREATAVFSQSLAIPDLLEQLDEEDPSVVYASLD